MRGLERDNMTARKRVMGITGTIIALGIANGSGGTEGNRWRSDKKMFEGRRVGRF